MDIVQTQRGFSKGSFTDYNSINCSIQESSLATDDCIWLGIDVPRLTVFEDTNMGSAKHSLVESKYIETDLPKNWSVDSRMHLTRQQVSDLLPLLQRFVDTGSL
jgi:hypothetical protein